MSGFLETLEIKGPCTVSETTYKAVKELHRKLLSMCKPLPAGVFESVQSNLAEPYILISEEPKVIGLPPGLRVAEKVSEIEADMGSLHQKIIHADKTQSDRAAGAHQKLIALVRKVKIIFCTHNFQSLTRSLTYVSMYSNCDIQNYSFNLINVQSVIRAC